jgi:hypothetical protein
MKKMLLSIALAVVASVAWGQTTRQPLMNERQVPQQQPQRGTTTTTATTEGTGTITEFTPGSAIVLRESSGPVRYRFGKTVTYVTRSGRVLDESTVKTKIRVGVPVRVHYTGTGANMVADRVILDED